MEWQTPKSEWGPGPWQSEPDRVEWRALGLPALIVRGPMGALCGYVAVPRDHPLYGVNYQNTPDNLEVHGGLTYSGKCAGDICHTPNPGEPADVWWFGFDCGHVFDLAPRMRATLREIMPREGGKPGFADDPTEVYRDLNYVRRQVARLARQLRQLL